MSTDLGSILDSTMAGLKAGIQVTLIATPTVYGCSADEDVFAVLNKRELSPFSQILVHENGHAVGVLERQNVPIAGKVAEHMRRLDDSMMIAASAPVTTFMKISKTSAYRLVFGDTIDGIVTRSDLQKLPVCLLAFAVLSHLEMLMAALIRKRCGNEDTWLAFLDQPRQKKIWRTWQKRQREDRDLDKIEFTDMKDKRAVVRALYGLDEDADKELCDLERLRNAIMHARPAALDKFVCRYETAQKWIDKFQSMLADKQEAAASST